MIDIEKLAKDKYKKAQEKSLEMHANHGVISEPYIWLPNLSLNKEQLPEVASWDVGEEYYLLVKVRMTGYNENKTLKMEQEESSQNPKKSLSADYRCSD